MPVPRGEFGGERISRLLIAALALLVLSRLLSLGFYPLSDMTESRYADIGRRMVERADWIVPWFTDTQPFWGKPVLSFWVTAAGMKLFGINEWGARVPHFALGLWVGAIVWRQAHAHSRRMAWHAVALLAGSAGFLIAAGAVMTDMALVLGTTLAMSGFWNCVGRGRTDAVARAALFGGLAIGLLAKGPIALVLWGVPVALWALWQRQVRQAWRGVPWIGGCAIVLVLVIPWYLAAESRSPGFLHYFIVGEHWHRFLTPGWSGDLYGTAHSFPRGSIWVFAAAALAPWILLLPLGALARAGAGPARRLAVPELRYLLLWALWPCVFFTASGNVLWTYALPGLPAAALLAAAWTAGARRPARVEGIMAAVLLALALGVPALVVAGRQSGRFDLSSKKALVQAWAERAAPDQPLLEVPKPSFSTSFYANGRVQPMEDVTALRDLPAGRTVFVVLGAADFSRLPADMQGGLITVAANPAYRLVRWEGTR